MQVKGWIDNHRSGRESRHAIVKPPTRFPTQSCALACPEQRSISGIKRSESHAPKGVSRMLPRSADGGMMMPYGVHRRTLSAGCHPVYANGHRHCAELRNHCSHVSEHAAATFSAPPVFRVIDSTASSLRYLELGSTVRMMSYIQLHFLTIAPHYIRETELA